MKICILGNKELAANISICLMPILAFVLYSSLRLSADCVLEEWEVGKLSQFDWYSREVLYGIKVR